MMDTLATSDELVLFKDLIPPMLASLKRCTQPGTNDEELLGEVLEVLAELAQTPVPVLNAHVPELVPFLLDMVKSDELDGQTRDSAGLVLSTLAEWKPKLIGKKGLVPTIVEGEQGRRPEQGRAHACLLWRSPAQFEAPHTHPAQNARSAHPLARHCRRRRRQP